MPVSERDSQPTTSFDDNINDVVTVLHLAIMPRHRTRSTDIAMHVIWSTTQTGLIELYVNGKFLETLTGPNMDGATRTKFDIGIYNTFIPRRDCEMMPTQVVYCDNLRRDLTRSDVN